MSIENKAPGKDVSSEDLETKFPLCAKQKADHKSQFDIAGVKFGSRDIPIFAGPNMVESRELIIETAKKESEKNILEKTKKFHQLAENKKISTQKKIEQMKENALKEIKNISIKISIESVENIIKNSIDKNKLDKLYTGNLEEIKKSLKETKA